MPFREHIAAMQYIEANTDFLVLRIIQALEDIILKYQREQLAQGELETGNPIEPNYKGLTVRLRSAQGLQVAFPDLNFTGQHYSNFYIDFGEDWFEITNDDPKAPRLCRNSLFHSKTTLTQMIVNVYLLSTTEVLIGGLTDWFRFRILLRATIGIDSIAETHMIGSW